MEDRDEPRALSPSENPRGAPGRDDPWQVEAGSTFGSEPDPERQRKRRSCLTCCSLAVLVPLLVLLILVAWINSGPEPSPADCLPESWPVKIVLRDPARLLNEYTVDDRWRELVDDMNETSTEEEDLPSREEVAQIAGKFSYFVGPEVAVAANGKGRVFFAARSAFLTRALGKLAALFGAGDAEGLLKSGKGSGDPYLAFLGQTMLMSEDRAALLGVLGRREAILAGEGSAAPPEDVRLEVRFEDLKPPAEGLPADDLRALQVCPAALDLPGLEGISGHLRLNGGFDRLSGELVFPAGEGGAPPALAGRKSSGLVPADALGYWLWGAPGGKGRWSAAGRLEAVLALDEGLEARLQGFQAAGIDLRKLAGERLIGERAVFIAPQERAGGKPLMAAASVMLEARDAKALWPTYMKFLEVYNMELYRISPDGKPPKIDGVETYPYFARRSYRGSEYLELVEAYYPMGSGYRPAFGVVGDFLVATTSRMELERMIDRAAGRAAGRTLADLPELAGQRGDPARAALFVFQPGGHGQELADLGLLVQRLASKADQEPGEQEAKQWKALGKLLSRVKLLRAEWLPQPDGSLKIKLEGSAAPPSGK